MKKLFKTIKDIYYRVTKTGVEYARHKGVNIGDNCRIYTHHFGIEPWLITIGNNVTITGGVIILTHDGSACLIKDEKGRRYLYKKVEIHNNVFIGVNSIIMPGVIINDNVIIAAGSIVTKSIPSGVIVAGNPAKIIGDYSTYEKRALDEYISEKDLDYKLDYKKRINSVLDVRFKKYMTNE